MPDNTRWFEPFGAPQLHEAVAAVRSFRAPLPAFVGGNAAVPSPRSASSTVTRFYPVDPRVLQKKGHGMPSVPL